MNVSTAPLRTCLVQRRAYPCPQLMRMGWDRTAQKVRPDIQHAMPGRGSWVRFELVDQLTARQLAYGLRQKGMRFDKAAFAAEVRKQFQAILGGRIRQFLRDRTLALVPPEPAELAELDDRADGNLKSGPTPTGWTLALGDPRVRFLTETPLFSGFETYYLRAEARKSLAKMLGILDQYGVFLSGLSGPESSSSLGSASRPGRARPASLA